MQEWDPLADWYDLLWPRTEDFSFYADLAAELGGPVLELGCGTGRMACELASRGCSVIGIDISAGQLRRAELRKASLPMAQAGLLDFRLQDMTDFRMAERFRLIVACFSTMFELEGPAARIATYRRCLEHLTDDGVLALDNFFRGAGVHSFWGKYRPEGVVEFFGSFAHPSQPETVVYHFEAERYGPEGRMAMTILLDEAGGDGRLSRKSFEVIRNYASADQTQAELRQAGFTRIELYGSFRREPFLDPKLQGRGRQVFLARK